jgi:mannose-6-phosphate isomerase class I
MIDMDTNQTNQVCQQNENNEQQLRKSSQFLMPARLKATPEQPEQPYNIYPVCSIGGNKIFNGYHSLAYWIIQQKTVVIDGYGGVFWDAIKSAIHQQITAAGLTLNWIETAAFLKSPSQIDNLLQPFLGTSDSVWGSRCLLELKDLYNVQDLTEQQPKDESDINVVIGCGAALANWDAPIVYIDLPKNEVQYRMRGGSITNLGSDQLYEPFLMYKRFYFVDWVLLNEHKKQVLDRVSVIADSQFIGDINWMHKVDFVDGLNKISNTVIRVRPWFEPGTWGGQWMKHNIPQINKEVINYAWSFELIVPENGLILESDGYLLEVSFDFLMFKNRENILGNHADKFGNDFPIRFDFLDTYDGGNLSIQCHPRLKYIQELFGETITQDETYYILDCKEDAKVYLGFNENIIPDEFRQVLLNSQDEGVEVVIDDFVQSYAAKKHELFLIPNGTIHSAGVNNMVLEISATPYIFTFKMYDWLRLDLDGRPRPINIDHAFKNLDFERKGSRVQEELISKPVIIEKGEDWQLTHLPTHADHFYDVHRFDFATTVTVETDNCCHVMMLVEGESIMIETANGSRHQFSYAETFVIPAAAQSYRLTNLDKSRAKVIKAFLK